MPRVDAAWIHLPDAPWLPPNLADRLDPYMYPVAIDNRTLSVSSLQEIKMTGTLKQHPEVISGVEELVRDADRWIALQASASSVLLALASVCSFLERFEVDIKRDYQNKVVGTVCFNLVGS